MKPFDTDTLIDNALCIWDVLKDVEAQYASTGPKGKSRDCPLYAWLKEDEGAANARCNVARLACMIEHGYTSLTEDQQGQCDCFDWDFVPHWLDYVADHAESPSMVCEPMAVMAAHYAHGQIMQEREA